MNFKTIFFFVLLTQASASFFDVFRGAMSSVAESFENLMSDVVTDVRNTIDCSILAVKQVLALGGAFADEADYDRICKGVLNSAATKTNVPNTPVISVPSLDSVSTVAPTVEMVHSKKLETHNISKIVDSAVQNIKNKMSILNDTSNIHKKFEETKNIIKQDISGKLHTELDNITKDVKEILRGGISHSDEKDILQDVDKPKLNVTSPPEIVNVLDGIISSVSSNSNESTLPIVIPHESKVSNETLSLVKHQLEDRSKEPEDSGKTKEIESVIKTFEKETGHDEESAQIGKEATKNAQTYKVISNNIEVPKLTPILSNSDFDKKEEPFDQEPLVPEKDQENMIEDYSVYGFHQITKSSESRKAAFKSFIEESTLTDNIMSSYFSKAKKVGKSVFDNVDLLT